MAFRLALKNSNPIHTQHSLYILPRRTYTSSINSVQDIREAPTRLRISLNIIIIIIVTIISDNNKSGKDKEKCYLNHRYTVPPPFSPLNSSEFGYTSLYS